MRLQKLLAIFFLVWLPTQAMSFMNCFNFSVGGEALYWKPCIEPYLYGEILAENSNEQLTLSPDYKWGWRIFANLGDIQNCRFVDGEWAHVKDSTKKTKRANGETLIAFSFDDLEEVAANSIEASVRTQYDKAGGKAGFRLRGNKCLYFYGYLGGRWIRIDVEQKSIIDADDQDIDSFQVSSQTLFRGGAFEAGIGGHANILCGLGASFRLGALAPIVKRKHTFFSVVNFTEEPSSIVENCFSDHLCKGGFEVRGGINYIHMCRCAWLKVEVGYELDYYFQALLREQPTLNSVNIIADDFAIGGPYVGVTLGF